MKRTLLLCALAVLVASATYVEYRKSSMGNISGSKITAAAADTMDLGSFLLDAHHVCFFFKADSVDGSLVNLIPTLQYREAGTEDWQSLTLTTRDAGDTWCLSGSTAGEAGIYIHDTIDTEQANGKRFYYPRMHTSRVILTGKRAAGVEHTNMAQNCTLVVTKIKY